MGNMDIVVKITRGIGCLANALFVVFGVKMLVDWEGDYTFWTTMMQLAFASLYIMVGMEVGTAELAAFIKLPNMVVRVVWCKSHLVAAYWSVWAGFLGYANLMSETGTWQTLSEICAYVFWGLAFLHLVFAFSTKPADVSIFDTAGDLKIEADVDIVVDRQSNFLTWLLRLIGVIACCGVIFFGVVQFIDRLDFGVSGFEGLGGFAFLICMLSLYVMSGLTIGITELSGMTSNEKVVHFAHYGWGIDKYTQFKLYMWLAVLQLGLLAGPQSIVNPDAFITVLAKIFGFVLAGLGVANLVVGCLGGEKLTVKAADLHTKTKVQAVEVGAPKMTEP
jgi:hypothetical protein